MLPGADRPTTAPTDEQQADWAKRTQAGLAAHHRASVCVDPQAVIADGGRAREQMLHANLGLVRAQLAWHEGEDRLQDGILGLLMAIDRFDPAYGVRFSSFAVGYIRKAVGTGREGTRLWRVPRETLSQWSAIERELETLSQQGDDPDVYEAALRADVRPYAAAAWIDDRTSATLGDDAADGSSPVDRVVDGLLVEQVGARVDRTTRQVLQLRRSLSREETAETLGVDVRDVARAEAWAIAACWHPSSGLDVHVRDGDVHGRRNTYVDGCRCLRCRRADREYKRAHRNGASVDSARPVRVPGGGPADLWVTFEDAARSPTPGRWRDQAACRGQAAGPDADAATLGCDRCPVVDACRDYGLEVTGLPGTWGGLGLEQRLGAVNAGPVRAGS